ncbi:MULTISPECIES: FAD:protein FMN transferase [Subtercola]|uniref:FAD:protein FMN transferase n=1 Tax=Subtercola vilae TaxID=2056433 RepID=A0A4T2C8T1_9MICO|nr:MULTISPECIES: FAD:protein FMN transferase [Subtercola]MEA9983843.1 FAD:protein FMN transferase [Subtercola sp. RTI3]TIH40620.1 FAD:protein FMN transferase [Subtercola vilae]
MRTHTFQAMGTVVSIRLRTCVSGGGGGGDYDALEEVFRALDERFSLYRADSELSAVARADLPLTAASTTLRDAYEQAIGWRNLTGGAFTPHRPDGVIDLSGIVKAQAMASAAPLLDQLSPTGWLLNVGGDVLAGGGDPWQVGIVDPRDRQQLLGSVPTGPGWRAVATSGTAERGEHIWRTGALAEFVQVTVLAADIVTADVLATAILAGGHSVLDLVTRTWPLDVLAIDRNGALRATPNLRASLT